MGNWELHDDIDRVDWEALKSRLAGDDFDNGRTAAELRQSFVASGVVVFAEAEGVTVGKARALADGVCNAYVVDVWTLDAVPRAGHCGRDDGASPRAVPGHHVYLQADDTRLYDRLGFRPQPVGMSLVSGAWLNRRDDAG